MDRRRWPELRQNLEALFRTRSQAEWCALMEGTDICFAPVLDLHEAPRHRHNRARGTYVDIGGLIQPGPAPRFSRSVPEVAHPPHQPGADTEEVLDDWEVLRPT
jgi:alpha-methylacyl-CoA racemase